MLFTLLKADIALHWHAGQRLLYPALVGTFLALLLPLFLPPAQLQQPFLLYFLTAISLLFAVLHTMILLFEEDVADGTTRIYANLRLSAYLLFAEKMLLHWIIAVLPLVCILPLLLLYVYHLPAETTLYMLLGALLVSLPISQLATLFALMSSTLRRSGALLALICLPFFIPLLSLAVSLPHVSNQPGQAQSLMLLLLGMNSILLPLGLWLGGWMTGMFFIRQI